MAQPKRILDVGQCGVDGPRMGRFLTRELGAVVDRAHSKDEAAKMTAEKPYALVLVNRVLDRDRSSGLEVIKALKTAHPDLNVMLVSDFDDAQDEAVKLSALRGFGKAAMDMPETEQLICGVLGQSA